MMKPAALYYTLQCPSPSMIRRAHVLGRPNDEGAKSLFVQPESMGGVPRTSQISEESPIVL